MGGDPAEPTRNAKDDSGTLTTHASTQIAGLPDWKGNERYEVVRRVGEGGMGVVYEALDRERGQIVALKSLLSFTPAALFRFKQEFRTLADVHHPNLVRLYELVARGDNVFFTMELVTGTDLLSYVQKAETPSEAPQASRILSAAHTQLDQLTAPIRLAASDAGAAPGLPAKESPADFDRLRRSLRQLVAGVHALHGAGKLHRDIKPSNVLVAEDGRVVILDFGVATDLTHRVDANQSEADEIVGTVRYMAPEQAMSEALTPASDWYSVGVVLYEALVGRAPFTGSALDVIAMKNAHDPTPPAQCVEGVPPELDALCRALLDRDPEMRPTGPEILQRLATAQSLRPVHSSSPGAEPGHVTELVGRERQLASLHEALEQALSGSAVTVRIAGASGMGKSAVAEHFLEGLAPRHEALVLRGRAYERESVPYKAVDSAIDALSRHLVHLEDQGETIRAARRHRRALSRVPGSASGDRHRRARGAGRHRPQLPSPARVLRAARAARDAVGPATRRPLHRRRPVGRRRQRCAPPRAGATAGRAAGSLRDDPPGKGGRREPLSQGDARGLARGRRRA